MKTKKPIFRLVALAALSFFTGNEVVAQSNLGAACGCPAVASRPTKAITLKFGSTWTQLPSAAYGKELLGNQNIVLSCDTTWLLNEKLYIGSGSTITINPGTVIKGTSTAFPAEARALIIERGGKIMAPGVEECPIVFTAFDDDLSGSYAIDNKGKWGGVLICGKATNNLTYTPNGPYVAGGAGKLAVADGLGVLEGFASSYPQDQFGVNLGGIPSGYALGTSPTGSYSFTGTATAAQNASGQTALVTTTATIPAHLLTYISGKAISGTGIALGGTTVASAATSTITLSANSTANLSGTYTIGVTQSAAATSGNTIGSTLTLAAANTQIAIGMIVTGTGIPTNTTVNSISGADITLSSPSTLAMTGTYTFTTPGASSAGSGSTASTALTLSGSTTGTIVSGMSVSGTGIAAGTTVVSITGTAVVLSANSTAAMTGTYTFGNPSFTAADILNTTGSPKVKLTSTLPYVVVGTKVMGAGLPTAAPFAYVASISSGVITLTLNASNTVTSTLTFSNDYPNPGATAYFPIMGDVNSPTPIGSTVVASNTVYVNYGGISISAIGEQFQDNDNSGVLKYVSIRFSGANLLVGSEINGLTLASVGRGTTVENVEIVSCADDNIEIFGGTVNLKYCTTLFGNDDMYDYDLGWTGKAQFLFGMKSEHVASPVAGVTPYVSPDNDNGFECDGGDNGQNALPSNPTIYNATIIGNAKTAGTADNRSLSGMNFKDGAKGTINNSVFAGFKNGLNVENGLTAPLTVNAFQNWSVAPNTGGNGSGSVKVKCNTFVGVTNPMVLNASTLASDGTIVTANTTQFTSDNNLVMDQSTGVTAGFNYAFAMNGLTNVITTKNDVVPNVGVAAFQLGATCPQAITQDQFFSVANFRGAFAPSNTNDNWLSDWSYSEVLNSTKGVKACPTDINNDGVTNVNDFLIFTGSYGQACN